MAKTKPPTGAVSFSHSAFRPYVAALGQLALAWNELHEYMGLLFCTVMGGGFVNQYLAIWHALKMDRAQRDVLWAAVQADTRGAVPVNYLEDIKWLRGQADRLEEARNNAIHSPLLGIRYGPKKVMIGPRESLGHMRAGKLAKNKNIIAEFRRCRDASLVLAKFVFDMDRALSMMDDKHPWPDRSRLPTHPGTNTR